jgi:phage-related protein
MTEEPPLKPVVWVGSSRKDLRKFPDPVQHQVGYAIYIAQRGGKHRDAKVLTGFGGAGEEQACLKWLRIFAATRFALCTP